MILSSIDWGQLWRESRPEIIGGLVVAVVGVIATAVWQFLRRKKSLENAPAPVQAPPPPPQEVRVKVETVPPGPQPPPAPLVTPAGSKGYIPRPPIAGFVARRDENGRDIVERLKEELAPEKEQLVVLWGAGGVGKTTLAAQTARGMRDVCEGRVIWTSADGKPDYSLSTLLDEIATHLERVDLRQLAPGPKDEEVHLALSREPNTLIVLDNLETVSPEEQEKCADWLANRASCPALITSRDEVAHARPVRISAMSLTEAREFLKRLISDSRNPRVFDQLDQEQIIQAAERVPLILQWVVKQIDAAKQPSSVMKELSQGEGDAAKRVFDRSFKLAQVGDDGRSTLLALSLFVPSASRDALCDVSGFRSDIERFERAVQQLVELWLVETSENNERLRVEGLTRELTKARLDKHQSAKDYQRRFVAYFSKYSDAHLRRTPEDYTALENEKDNLMKAMEVAVELDDSESTYAFAYKIGMPESGMLSMRGYWDEALKMNQQALETARKSNLLHRVSDFSHNLGIIFADRGDLVEAQRLANESLEIDRKLNDKNGTGKSLFQLATIAYQAGDLDEARRLYDESLEILRDVGQPHDIAQNLHQLGVISHVQGELEEARRLYNESLEIKENLFDERSIAISLHQLALLAHDQGELEEARRLYNQSLEIDRRLGDQSGTASTLGGLARLAEHEGNSKEAARLYREALVIFERLKSPVAELARSDLERIEGKVSPG